MVPASLYIFADIDSHHIAGYAGVKKTRFLEKRLWEMLAGRFGRKSREEHSSQRTG